jgi:hypothetical protein
MVKKNYSTRYFIKFLNCHASVVLYLASSQMDHLGYLQTMYSKTLFSSRRLVVQSVRRVRLEGPTRLCGQVGRLAGDLNFSVD